MSLRRAASMRTSASHSVRQRASTIVRIIADTGGGERIFAPAIAACTRRGEAIIIQPMKSEAERVDRALP